MDLVKIYIEERWDDFLTFLKAMCVPEEEIEKYAKELMDKLERTR